MKCENKSLKQQLEESRQIIHLLKLKIKPNPVLNKPDKWHLFESSDEYLPLHLWGGLEDYSFLTITFDPRKFGSNNGPYQEQKYILWSLKELLDHAYVEELTGSFEYQKNGTTHAHILVKRCIGKSDSDITKYLVPMYTDIPQRQKAILCVPAKFPSVINYIKKESEEYFRYQDPNNEIQGVWLQASNNLWISQQPLEEKITNITQLYENYRKEQLKARIEFAKKIGYEIKPNEEDHNKNCAFEDKN